MFNSGMISSALGIIAYDIIPTPGCIISNLHLIFETILVQAIGVAAKLSSFCASLCDSAEFEPRPHQRLPNP